MAPYHDGHHHASSGLDSLRLFATIFLFGIRGIT